MGAALNTPDAALKGRLTHGFFEDFDHYVTADRFTTVATDSGTVAVADGVGGIVTLTPSDSTAADNDEVYIHSTIETFKMAADKPITFAAYIQYTEANTSAANVAAGLCDAVAANTIVDDGAGMRTTMDGAVIYKVDGGTVWKFVTSNATTQTISTSTTTAGGSSYQLLEIEVIVKDASNCTLIPKVDGVQLQDSNGNNISHTIAYSSMDNMQAFVGLKQGSTTGETVLVDYISCWQKR